MKHVSPLLGFNNNIRYRGKIFHVQTEDSGVKRPHVITHLFTDGGRIIKTAKTSYAEHLERDDLAEHVKKVMMEQHKAMFVALKEGQFDSVIVALDGGAPVAELASNLKETQKENTEKPLPKISAGLAAAAAAAAGKSSMLAAKPVAGATPPVESTPTPPSSSEPITEREKPTAPGFGTPRRARRSVPPPAINARAVPVSPTAPTAPAIVTPNTGFAAISPPASQPAPSAPASSSQPEAAHPASEPPKPSTVAPRVDTTYRTVIPPPDREKPRPASGRHAVSRPASIFASTRPTPQNSSIFGEDRISDKSLDEVILTYLAEDLDSSPKK